MVQIAVLLLFDFELTDGLTYDDTHEDNPHVYGGGATSLIGKTLDWMDAELVASEDFGGTIVIKQARLFILARWLRYQRRSVTDAMITIGATQQ